jgi:hypothetical protein
VKNKKIPTKRKRMTIRKRDDEEVIERKEKEERMDWIGK